MSLVIAILAVVDNLPLSKWTLPIQPNSLVAVFTAIGKSAMMVCIVSCLSQLKWHHFSHAPQPLDHLQTLDEASRGPWGAFVLLFKLKRRALVPWALALVTLASLGIEPAAQQALEVRTRSLELDALNQPAKFSIANSYHSRFQSLTKRRI